MYIFIPFEWDQLLILLLENLNFGTICTFICDSEYIFNPWIMNQN